MTTTLKFTDATVRDLASGTYYDSGFRAQGATLLLRVSAQGVKTFDLVYRDQDGKRCRLGSKNFGPHKGRFPETTVKAARAIAGQAWKEICSGRDFVAERREADASPTVAEAAEIYFAALRASNEGYATDSVDAAVRQVKSFLKDDPIADMKCSRITGADVEGFEQRIITRAAKRPQSKRGGIGAGVAARDRLKTILNEVGIAPNPAVRPRQRRTKGSLIQKAKASEVETYNEDRLRGYITTIWQEIHADWMPSAAADMILMLLLTGQRTGEVRAARRDQIDLRKRIWTVPEDQPGNKAARKHVVPLTDAVCAMLRRRLSSHNSDLVFPYDRGRCFGKTYVYAYLTRWPNRKAKTKAISQLHGFHIMPHDLRRMAVSWFDMTPRHMWATPYVLNHAREGLSRVDRLYARGDMTDAIREALQEFEDWILEAVGTVRGGENVVKMERPA